MRYDKRKTGFKGLCLTENVLINNVQLKENDRLEPSETLPDVGAIFDDIDKFPIDVTFWRSSLETLTRHRNPIFDQEIGITPQRSLTADVLHAFF